MSKSKNGWPKFINDIINRKRSDRSYSLPRAYIEAVADNIHSANPTREIITNTLIDLSGIMFEHGYQRCLSDNKYRKEKRDKHIKDSWNRIKDFIDDEIHQKIK